MGSTIDNQLAEVEVEDSKIQFERLTLMTLTKVNNQLSIDTDTRVIHRGNFDHFYSEDCFVNAENYDFHRSSWRGHQDARAWVILDAGYVRAIVFAEYYRYSEQDALDEAADSGKLDFLQVSESELSDYETGKDSEGFPEYEGLITLGNASEYFDQENLEMFEVPANLFSLDPVIMAVIEEDSRSEAIEVLQDAQHTEDKDGDGGCDYPIGYHVLENAQTYLRTDALPVCCVMCHSTKAKVDLHVKYCPGDRDFCCGEWQSPLLWMEAYGWTLPDTL